MDEFHLNNIPVHEYFQRRKIEETLIKYVSAYLQKQDIQKNYLEVNGEKNQLNDYINSWIVNITEYEEIIIQLEIMCFISFGFNR